MKATMAKQKEKPKGKTTIRVDPETKILLDKIKRTFLRVYALDYASKGIIRLTDEETIRMMAWMLRKSAGVDKLETLRGTRLEHVFSSSGDK